MKPSKTFSMAAAMAFPLTGLTALAPASAEAQARSETGSNVLLIVGVAASALLALILAGGGGDQRTVSP